MLEEKSFARFQKIAYTTTISQAIKKLGMINEDHPLFELTDLKLSLLYNKVRNSGGLLCR